MRIDVHCHGWSEAYMDRVASYGVIPPVVLDQIRAMGGLTTERDLERRFALMADSGVDLHMLSQAGVIVYLDDQHDAAEFARFANEEYASIAEAYPNHFRCLAVLPLPHVEAALAETEHALDELGLAGIGFHTSIGGRSLADPMFEPLWAELDRRAATVFVHPVGAGAHSSLINGYGLRWLLGGPIEDTFAAAHFIATALPLRYPNVKIINAQLGGGLSVLLGRLDDQPSAGDRFEHSEAPSAIARRMWYDLTSNRDVPALRCAAEVYGVDRLVLGTGFPWQTGERYRGGVAYVAEAGLSEEASAQILHRNAAGLFSVGQSVTGVG